MTDGTRKRRWMPLVLGLSLAVNLGVVAALSGAAWRHKGGADSGPPRAAKGGAIYMQALPREARQIVRQEMRGGGPRRQADTAEMLAVLRQEPFAPQAAAQVLDAQRDAGLARQNAASAAWLAQITAMTAQERSAYADRLEELSQRRTARWKKRLRPEN